MKIFFTQLFGLCHEIHEIVDAVVERPWLLELNGNQGSLSINAHFPEKKLRESTFPHSDTTFDELGLTESPGCIYERMTCEIAGTIFWKELVRSTMKK